MPVQVLVVSHDPLFACVAEACLNHFGSGAIHGSPSDAPQLSRNVDCVLVDLDGAGASGPELVKRIIAAAGTPILALTEQNAAADRLAGLQAGADDVMSKAYLPGELIARVNALVRHEEKLETLAAA